MSRPRWRVAAASVRGAAHEKAGLPCQDAHRWLAAGGEFLIAGVADGAGSAPFAEVGAAIAARTAVESAGRRLGEDPSAGRMEDSGWMELLAGTLADAKSAVESEAGTRSVPLSDLATTLILVVAGPGFVAAAQVGDGAVISADGGGELSCVSRPPAGEYLNETTFLTSSEAVACAKPVVWRGKLAHVAVISDGLQMAALKLPAAEPHPGFFKPLFGYMEEQGEPAAAQEALASFLASPRLRARTDDDVTLILGALIS